jgi:hypothetical protein
MEDNLIKRKNPSKNNSTKQSKPVKQDENFIQNVYHDLNKNKAGSNYNLIVPENTLIDKSTFYQEMVNTKVQMYLNSLSKFKNESLLGTTMSNGYFTNQIDTNYSYNEDIDKLSMNKKYVSYRKSISSNQKLKPIIEQTHDEINFDKAESLYFKKKNYNMDKSKELPTYHINKLKTASNEIIADNSFKSSSLQNFYITDSYVTETRPNAFTSYTAKRSAKKVTNDSVSCLFNEFKSQIKKSNDKARSNLLMKYDLSLRPLKLPNLHNNYNKLFDYTENLNAKKINQRMNQNKLKFNTTETKNLTLTNQVQNIFKNINKNRKL